MQNLFESNKKKEFYLWVDPNEFDPHRPANKVGSIVSKTSTGDNIMFIPNPAYKGIVTIFQADLLLNYNAEYNLELYRRQYLYNYPSRWDATLSFDSREEAEKYRARHPDHVDNRELKSAYSVGQYQFSRHDNSWIDFLRLKNTVLDKNTIRYACQSYWEGVAVEQCDLQYYGQDWTETPLYELLFIGRIDFNKSK